MTPSQSRESSRLERIMKYDCLYLTPETKIENKLPNGPGGLPQDNFWGSS